MKIDADEKELLESVERGEWKPTAGGKRERTHYVRYAKATFRKDRRLNIRLSSKDLEAIQKRALAEGLPYARNPGLPPSCELTNTTCGTRPSARCGRRRSEKRRS